MHNLWIECSKIRLTKSNKEVRHYSEHIFIFTRLLLCPVWSIAEGLSPLYIIVLFFSHTWFFCYHAIATCNIFCANISEVVLFQLIFLQLEAQGACLLHWHGLRPTFVLHTNMQLVSKIVYCFDFIRRGSSQFQLSSYPSKK